MKYWLSSKNRKVHQRAMNRLMRILNKQIENDDVWKGRYYVRQKAHQWYEYEDKSGAELLVVLELHDQTTGKSKELADTVNHWRFLGGNSLWMAMNDFIVKGER